MSQAIEETKVSKIENLPSEIILDILSRLPITSLIQSKLVCRSWLNVIRDPSLVGIHLSHAEKHDPCLILQIIPYARDEMYFVGFSAHNNENGMVKRINPMAPEFYVVCSCDGLLCLFDSEDNDIYVCNPLIGTCFKVQKCPLIIRRVLGFGLNSTTNEYKVLVEASTSDISSEFRQRLQFYVLAIGSPAWRKLEDKCYDFVGPSLQVLVQGRLHWTARRSGDNATNQWRFCGYRRRRDLATYSIISFDLVDERFREVERPTCGSLDNIWYQLVELRGCLSAAVETTDGTMKIWVLKNYDEKDSWINEYVIGAYVPKQLEIDEHGPYGSIKFTSGGGSTILVLCLQKNNEILFQWNCRGLVSYNPELGTFTEHLFAGMPSLFSSTIHMGSLNHVNRFITS